MSKPFYITTAIDYLNGQPHLGHAYEKIVTDVIAEFEEAGRVATEQALPLLRALIATAAARRAWQRTTGPAGD